MTAPQGADGVNTDFKAKFSAELAGCKAARAAAYVSYAEALAIADAVRDEARAEALATYDSALNAYTAAFAAKE